VYLQQHGADVEITDDDDRDAYRAQLGIPDDAASCHTATVDGYALEGHIPVGAIQRLLADRPEVLGLALPGMPADSPGMGGDRASWERQAVLVIEQDGSLHPFEY
jgi:hypothetical protein